MSFEILSEIVLKGFFSSFNLRVNFGSTKSLISEVVGKRFLKPSGRESYGLARRKNAFLKNAKCV